MQSRDTHEDKLFAKNKGKSRFYCFFKNNFVVNGFESLYFVHYHLQSSAVPSAPFIAHTVGTLS